MVCSFARAFAGALALLAAVALLGPATVAAAEPSMKNRFDLLFRAGFGGSLVSDLGGVGRVRIDADASPGVELRGDLPIAKNVTMGPLVGLYMARPDARGFERNPAVDLAPFVKARHTFRAGKKKAEIYGLFHVGLTMAFIRKTTRESDRFGVGWNIGLTPGFQVMIRRRFGVLTELGWTRAQAFFSSAPNLILNQAIWRLGFVF